MREALHVIAGLGKSQGGPSYTVPRLCQSLRKIGWETHILTVDDSSDPISVADHCSAHPQDFAHIPIVRSLKMSTLLKKDLKLRSPNCSVIHAHGLWLMPNVYAGRAARTYGKPLIVSPRGMLSAEALLFSKRKKQVFWSLLQSAAYKDAAVWHATSEAEAEDLRKFGISAPIAIIPNGVDLPSIPSRANADREMDTSAARPRRLLFLSRIHPKKGLNRLLRVWANVSLDFPNWNLRVVGPDEGGHERDLKKLASELGIERIEFAGAIYGDAKWREYADADIFILPTLSENFGVSVAEALGMGVPAIVTKGAPWEGLVGHQCGWWVEGEEEALTSAIRQALNLSDEARRRMGENGRRWMNQAFGWSRIGENMSELYTWSQTSGSAPDFIFKD